ncbi:MULTISPECIES: DUF445 domain-containing protein [unclassified Frankia]
MNDPEGVSGPVSAGFARGTTDEAGLRRGLRRMRLIAGSLLAAVATIYLLAARWQARGGPGWIGYVAAAAEAGAVGALADWFAVTALFRHPLGLPIPHTAIIPRRKDALGRSLESFVGTHFLAEDVIREKIDGIGVSARVGAWLRQPSHAERVTTEAAERLTAMISGMNDDLVRELVEKAVLPRIVERPWAGALGMALERVVEDRLHHRLVDVIVTEAETWLKQNPEVFTRTVQDRAPSWSPKWLDEAVAAKAYSEALRFTEALRTDPEHRARRALDTFLRGFAGRLRTDEALGRQVEQIKYRLLAHPEVDRMISAMWATAKSILLDLASDPGSTARVRATDELAAFGAQLATDPELARTVDHTVANAATRVVCRYKDDIAAIIGDTVGRWQPDETSRRIELHVGRDLQFIRINGTVVGALVGLVIHLVTELAF